MKKKSILLSILIVAILIVCFYVSNYQENHTVFRSGRIAKPSSMFALMFETGENTGIYEEQTDTEWPYYREYVAELSGCENGSTLTWNDTTKTISVTGNISDKCYLYFGPILETAPRSTYVVPTCDGSSCGLVESVNVLTDDENDTYTIYTVGYIEDDSTTSVTYSIDITNLDIDLTEYKLVVDGTPQVMTTYQDFENYYIMKTKGEPETNLSNGSTLMANYTVSDLYTYALGTNELTIDSVQVSCNSTKCTATISESFSGLSNKAKHSTTTNGGDPISVVYNGIKFNLKKRDFGDIRLTINYDGDYPTSSASTKSISCNGNNVLWDSKSYGFNLDLTNLDVTNYVNCIGNFTYNSSLGSKKLNQYIMGELNEQPNPGNDNAIVHEIGEYPDFSTRTTVTQYGTTPVYYSTTLRNNRFSPTATQTTIGDYWTYSSSTGMFTSVPSEMTATGTSYRVYAQIPEEAYYEVCVTVNTVGGTQSSPYAYFYFIVNSKIYKYSLNSGYAYNDNCYTIGKLTTDDYINMEEYVLTSPAPRISFKLNKTTATNPSLDAGYRYEGPNPNNYIWFNDELWRIIGVFNSDGHGVSGNLTKIMRNTPLGSFSNFSPLGYWFSSAKAKVNHSYTAYKYVDYTTTGLKQVYKDMVVRTVWYKGGYSIVNEPGWTAASNLFATERNKYSISSTANITSISNIGLINASDYAFAVKQSDCNRYYYSLVNDGENSYLYKGSNYYTNSNCRLKNWMHGYGTMFIMNYYNTAGFNSYIKYYGIYEDANTYSAYLYPVVYLSDDVFIVSGSGTIDDPFIIGM